MRQTLAFAIAQEMGVEVGYPFKDKDAKRCDPTIKITNISYRQPGIST